MIPPLPPFPSLAEVEEYVWSLEDYIASQLPPTLHATVHKLYEDITRFGGGFPDFESVGLGSFRGFVEVPAPPPPPPKTTSELIVEWIARHKWAVALGLIAVAGAAGGTVYHLSRASPRQTSTALRRRNPSSSRVLKASSSSSSSIGQTPTLRREVLLVLGVDCVPYGTSLVQELVSSGYIVIASVSTPDLVEDLEKQAQGYVRALVFDPNETTSITSFLRSLNSTLSLRFPISSAGDPYASARVSNLSQPSQLPQLISIISLLSLAPTAATPFSSLNLSRSYIPHFTHAQFTPLAIIQGALPLLKRRGGYEGARASVIACVGAEQQVGLIGATAAGMATVGLTRGLEVLRRELRLSEDPDLSKTRVVIVDVGDISIEPPRKQEAKQRGGIWEKRPSDARTLADAFLGIIQPTFTIQGSISKTLSWCNSNRFSVGDGAYLFTLASYLPTPLLDLLISLPYHRSTLRQQAQSFHLPPASLSSPPPPDSATHFHRRMSTGASTVLGSRSPEIVPATEPLVAPIDPVVDLGNPTPQATPQAQPPNSSTATTEPASSYIFPTPATIPSLVNVADTQHPKASDDEHDHEDDHDLDMISVNSLSGNVSEAELDLSSEGEGAGTGAGTGKSKGSWVNVK